MRDQRRTPASQTPRAYQGRVRTALTRPPPPIVAVSRNPSRKPLDGTRTTGERRHRPAAAALQARRATRRAKRARNPRPRSRRPPPRRPHCQPGQGTPARRRPAPARTTPGHPPASHGQQHPSRRTTAPRPETPGTQPPLTRGGRPPDNQTPRSRGTSPPQAPRENGTARRQPPHTGKTAGHRREILVSTESATRAERIGHQSPYRHKTGPA